jgi:hypothetical protein
MSLSLAARSIGLLIAEDFEDAPHIAIITVK